MIAVKFDDIVFLEGFDSLLGVNRLELRQNRVVQLLERFWGKFA